MEVSNIELVLQPHADPRGRAGDLPRDKSFSAARAFMVEKNAVASKQAVRLAVVSHRVETVGLGASIRGTGIERRGFFLRYFLGSTVELAR
jgi:hypothetical protein